MEENEKLLFIPKDPQILCSFINTKLRDEYRSLDELCKSLGIEQNELVRKLKKIEYEYNPKENRFI